tara:strand:- start:65 stop:637 length:573 start_codon:yes stop_codon:yes gene_type:complete
MNEDGYFSVVKPKQEEKYMKYWDGLDVTKSYVLVRSRDRASIQSMLERLIEAGSMPDAVRKFQFKENDSTPPWTGAVWDHEGSDYEHRILIPTEVWAIYLSLTVASLDYFDYKGGAHDAWEKRGLDLHASHRARVLGRVWHILRDDWPRTTDLYHKNISLRGPHKDKEWPTIRPWDEEATSREAMIRRQL